MAAAALTNGGRIPPYFNKLAYNYILLTQA